jgi:hypothetical protein
MRFNQPNSLGKTIEARASNRPLKIAYLVPFDDAPNTHMTLDAVFFEAYTRWGGAYTLVVPTKPQEFLASDYDEWLRHYDPDFVYTYVEIDAGFVEKVDRLCSPMAFLKHKTREIKDREIDYRSFLPGLSNYIQPISSMTTVPSPASAAAFAHEEREPIPTVLTQYVSHPANRFLADNFGTAFSVTQVTHAVPGFFRTLCLVPADLPAHIVAGSERCTSALDALRALTDKKATAIARFAMANSGGMPRLESTAWAYAFRLFVGSTPIDRIHFWNCRQLGSNWSTPLNALILDTAFFDDEALVKQLGQFLNRTNFLNHSGGGQYDTELHSSSVKIEVLKAIGDKLAKHTWNAVRVSPGSFNASAIPSQQDLEERIRERSTDTTTLKLTEDETEVTAAEPAHFVYIPPRLREAARGQWLVELSIERHNNLSKYSNVVDTWALPRRRQVVPAFTKRLAKPTLGGRLALVPTPEGFPFRSQAIKETSSYELSLPTDEDFFRHLVLDFFRYPDDDLRASAPRVGYADVNISDKGQNLRGVISMFGQLSVAYEILTNRYWRAVLRGAKDKEDASNPLTFDRDKLDSFLPNDQATVQELTTRLHLENIGVTKNYLLDSLSDTLEHLVRINVFYQVAQWRCEYCGHANSRSFDQMKIRNMCDICETEYLAPIDIEWKYELNDFVYRSLQKHSGLPVLWTLGVLQDTNHANSFWYLPEVDLYVKHDDPESKNEIDILCVMDGAFLAVEAKLSASTFLNKEGARDKFLGVMARLRPDVALLAFERYCLEGEDVDGTKARLAEAVSALSKKIGPLTTVKVLVAQDGEAFNEFPADIGYRGRRVWKYH